MEPTARGMARRLHRQRRPVDSEELRGIAAFTAWTFSHPTQTGSAPPLVRLFDVPLAGMPEDASKVTRCEMAPRAVPAGRL
jgi:hypothetical protein